MTSKQQKQAFQKIYTTDVNDTSTTSELQVTQVVSEEICPILGELLEAGVDWLPQDVLTQKTKKAREIHDAGTAVEIPSDGTITTVIVPSRSNPQQPHIVNIYPNGKCECDKSCPGFSVEEICAHVLVACLKMSRLKDFLNWFVTAKRKTGRVNYTRAVSFGMPVGRGRKGKALPRKRKKRCPPATQVQRNETPPTNTRPFFQPSEWEHQFSAPAAQAQQIPTFRPPSHVNPIQQNVPQSVDPPRQNPGTPLHTLPSSPAKRQTIVSMSSSNVLHYIP